MRVTGAGKVTLPGVVLDPAKSYTIAAAYTPDDQTAADVGAITTADLAVTPAQVTLTPTPLADAAFGQKVVTKAHLAVAPAAAAKFTGGTLTFLDETGAVIGTPRAVPGAGDYKSAPFTPPGAGPAHTFTVKFGRTRRTSPRRRPIERVQR